MRNLIPNDWDLKHQHPDLAGLTAQVIEARYPGDWPDPSEDDAKAAVEQARAVWESVRRDFAAHGLTIEDPRRDPG